VGLLSSYPLGRSLESPSDKGAELFGVGGIIAIEDLEFPVLLDKTVGEDSIVVVCDSEDARECASDLRSGYVLSSETMRRFCVEGQTRSSTFPGASVTSGLINWGLWISVCELEGGSPMSD
jgi:hypothetical protein